jgi:hypothetical protein
VQLTAWSKDLRVSGDGSDVASHVGVVLLRWPPTGPSGSDTSIGNQYSGVSTKGSSNATAGAGPRGLTTVSRNVGAQRRLKPALGETTAVFRSSVYELGTCLRIFGFCHYLLDVGSNGGWIRHGA